MALGADVPEVVRRVFYELGNKVNTPVNQPKEVREIYERGERGRCMMCGGPLGHETLLIVNLVGVDQIYCSHKCNQDMNLLGWLQQTYDDIKQGVEFRGDPTGADVEPDDEQPELPGE